MVICSRASPQRLCNQPLVDLHGRLTQDSLHSHDGESNLEAKVFLQLEGDLATLYNPPCPGGLGEEGMHSGPQLLSGWMAVS